VSDPHWRKQHSPKISTDEGITISINSVPANARFSIRDNLDSDSNLTSESELHFEKQSSPHISIDERITISSNPVPENVCFSIRANFDPDSIITDESNLHSKKSNFHPKLQLSQE
jgi:hypothetical protein